MWWQILRDFISQKINIKNFKIKTRIIKSLMEEEILSGTKWGIGWTSTPPTLYNLSLPAERILNALHCWTLIAMFWRNHLASLGSPVASTRLRPFTLKMTPAHCFDCNWLKLSSILTVLALLGAISSFHCWPIQVYRSNSINTRAIPNQTPTINNKKTNIPSGRDSSPLSNPGSMLQNR